MNPALPQHDKIGFTRRVLSAFWLALAVGLVAWHVTRIASALDAFSWRFAAVALAGVVAADFASGVVHWFADTWGSVEMLIIGRRLLHPFRVHHLNPDDFLRRSFLDTNGDVAAVVVLMLAATAAAPVDSRLGLAATVFMVAFAGVGLFTNQIHQWAHMPAPPAAVRLLQRCGLILSCHAHRRHHQAPYVAHYCITTGWCNRPLAATGLFRHAERLVTRLTGAIPRADEAIFNLTISSPPPLVDESHAA